MSSEEIILIVENVISYAIAFAKDYCIPLGLVVGALGALKFGPKYKEKISKLEARKTVIVNNPPGQTYNTEINLNIDDESKKNLRRIIN